MVNLYVEKYLSKHLQKVLIDYGANYLITPMIICLHQGNLLIIYITEVLKY